MLSSFNVACAYAFLKTLFFADAIFLVALATCVAKGTSGQDSYDWSMFELRCLTPNTILIEPFCFLIFKYY